MNVISKKKEVFGKIGAIKTLTEGLPKLKLSSSFSSINNSGDVISFLTDLVKTLVGFEALVSSVIDTITHSLPRIEKEVKKALKVELKNIVSCGVNPSLPSWMKSTGPGINIQVKKIDFADILRTDPNSVAGQLIYNDITTPLIDSSDFNTFLYGVIQDDEAQQNGGQGQIVLNQDGQQIVLNNEQIVQIIQKQQEQLQHFAKILQDKDKIISGLESQLEVYKIMNEKNNSIIQLLQKNQ